MRTYFSFLIVISFCSGLSCKKDLSCTDCIEGNKPPVANAGRDTIITLPVDSIQLDGSGSHDPDGSITVYQWAKISGPSFSAVSNGQAPKTAVKNLVQGVYDFELAVTDNRGLAARDTVTITVVAAVIPNRAPIANAGPDQMITHPVDSAIVDGSASSDADGRITQWQWTKIAGPASFLIENPIVEKTKVKNLATGIYQFQLSATDDRGLTAKDTVQIIVQSNLSGREVTFDNLIWEYWNSGTPVFDEIYLFTPETPDLFFGPPGSFEVSLKFDTATNWLPVNALVNGQCTGYAFYVISSPKQLLIERCGLDYSIVGKKVSVKVRFL